MTSRALGDQGGSTLFALGGVMFLIAYFWGLSIGPGDDPATLITWVFDYALAFVGLYLIGLGLWTITHSALGAQQK